MEPTKAEVGEKYTLPTGTEVVIAEPCDKNNGYWHCMSHQEGFQNNLQKDIHLDQHKKSSCKLAWVCWEHGFERP